MISIKDLDSSDWIEVFKYASNPNDVRNHCSTTLNYTFDDIEEVIAYVDGEGDGDNWVGLFKMKDEKFLSIRAGCDYTGWGCREDGSSEVADDLGTIIVFGLTLEERDRLGIKQL